MLISSTRPRVMRSSGTWPTPADRKAAAFPLRGLPSLNSSIWSGRRRPVRTSMSSVWPLPSMPAMPRISPLRRERHTSRRRGTPRSVRERPRTEKFSSPTCSARRVTESSTSRPTIICASSFMVVPATGTPLSIILPWRSTDTRSAISMVSLSLWVMIMMLLPAALSCRMTRKRSSTSWGVSTAVGSSRISRSAPR